jgi:hypothetical protein
MSSDVHVYSSRRMYYGPIKLVPVFADFYPYNQERYEDMWHVPGRTIMSTDALVTMATRRKVAVSIVEQEGVSTSTTRLN